MSTGHRQHGSGLDPEELRRIVEERKRDPRVIFRLRIQDTAVNYVYDIPYIAGYSEDARTIYIDREFPRDSRLLIAGRLVSVILFILLHEKFEKGMIDFFGEGYDMAHALAETLEDEAVTLAGIKPRLYERAFVPYAKADAKEQIRLSPPDLDLTPYRDSGDWDLVAHLEATRDRPHVAYR